MEKDKKINKDDIKNISIEEMTLKNEDSTPKNIFDDEGESINDKVSLLAIGELLNKNNLKGISRVKFEQVNILTKLYLFADVFDIPFTKDLADNIMEIQISVNGLGRKELVSLVQQRGIETEVPKQNVTSKNIFK